MITQLMGICEEEELDLSKEVHSLDLKNNEWHIAVMQIYENLFKEDAKPEIQGMRSISTMRATMLSQ